MKYKLTLLAGLIIPAVTAAKWGANTVRSMVGAPNPRVPEFSKSESQPQEITNYQSRLQKTMSTRNQEIELEIREFYTCVRENQANIDRAIKNQAEFAALNQCYSALQEALTKIGSSKKNSELNSAENTGKLYLPKFITSTSREEEPDSE